MIQTHDLSKRFADLCAVEGVTLSVSSGQVLALLGPNGAGKTTTVRMLTSVLKPSRGSAVIAGYDVLSQPKDVRANVGVLTEQHGLYGRMPANEYLDFFGRLYGLDSNTRSQRINDLLEIFGLKEDSQRRLGEYSKGMRQKLALARALIHEPPVLLLDEPTSAMDPESACLVREAIRQLRSANRTIIICTHNLAEAEELADQIAIIRLGKIILNGTPTMLKYNLLGSAEYEVHFGIPLDGRQPLPLPEGVKPTGQGQTWFRYQAEFPSQTNPLFLKALLQNGIPVLSLQEVPRSLEQVYLQAVQGDKNKDGKNG
jgi:ABC-2 type transport system ATP-binding protein